MKPRYRALIWEQSRTAGVLCFVIVMFTLLLQASVFGDLLWQQTLFQDAVHTARMATFWALLLAAAVLLVRQDGHAHLALDFEPRLLHLPAKTVPVLTIVFSTRVLFLFLLGLILMITYRLFFGQSMELQYLVVTLHVYACAQALLWVRHSITGLNYTVPLGILGMSGALVFFGVEPNTLAEIAEQVWNWFTHPPSLLLTLPGALVLAARGIVWQRRDERHGFPPADEALAWLHEIRSVRVYTFESPLEAQLWFEQRRVGRLLPALTLLFSLVFALLFTVLPNLAFDAHTRYLYAPFAGLLAAAIICGRIGLRPRSRFPFHRPQTATMAALSILLIQLRGLFFCFLLVSGLSVLGMLLSGYDGVLMVQMLRMGDLDWIGTADLVLRPAFAVTLIAWALLWISTLPFLLPTLAVFIAFFIIPDISYRYSLGWEHVQKIEDYLMDKGFMLPIICLVFYIAGLTLVLVLKKGLYAPRHLFWGFILLQSISLVLLASTPYLGTHFFAVLACLTIAAMILLPLTAAPLSILHYRLKA